jgi:hypothetical protein
VIVFNQLGGSTGRLYAATTQPPGLPDGGWAGLLVSKSTTVSPLPDSVTGLGAALGRTDLACTFVLSAIQPDLSSGGLAKLVPALDGVVGNQGRLIVWLTNPANVSAATTVQMLLAGDGTWVGAIDPTIVPPSRITLQTLNSANLTAPADALLLSGQNAAGLIGTNPPWATGSTRQATIPFSGPLRGCVQFATTAKRADLLGKLYWGFQFVAPNPAISNVPAYGEWAPFASADQPTDGDQIGLTVTVDPSDPLGAADKPAVRTAMAFTGTNQGGAATSLHSYYTTTSGERIDLVPQPGTSPADPTGARLVFNLGIPTSVVAQANFQAAPAGLFTMSVPTVNGGATYRLMCGVQGTECIHFTPRVGATGSGGDQLCFKPRQKAYAPVFPPKQASPVEPPVDPNAPPLDSTYTTSWASFVPAVTGSGGFVGQPGGFALFGADQVINHAYATMYGPTQVPVNIDASATFPLVPYLGAPGGDGSTAFSSATIEQFERSILAPLRRAELGPPSRVGAARAAVTQPFNSTTPMGLLQTVNEGNGSTEQLLLGMDREGGTMLFTALAPLLQQAFQTGQLFLVVANGNLLGTPVGPGPGAFQNSVDIGGWTLTADVGVSNYADYTNVIVVKGRPGPLYHPPKVSAHGATDPPPDPSLIASPDKWTMATDFAAPTRSNSATQQQPVHEDELVAVSSWLQAYFRDAAGQKDRAYFDHFNQIAKDETWTGILVLRMAIEPPADLAGIAAGVRDPSQFYAHHLGIEVSPVKNPAEGGSSVELAHASSMFGLIHYEDASYVDPAPGKAVQPVLPGTTTPYDFVLLTLKALFADSSVQSFESYAQLTLGSLFDADVTTMGGQGANELNTLVLSGSYQDNGGTPVYSLASAADTTFAFDNNVLQRVEITGAQMTTRSAADPVDTWFELQGFLDFAVVKSKDGSAFDVLSFGNDPATVPPAFHRGLAFAGLAIEMKFDKANPLGKKLSFQSSEIRFDIATSTPRDGSLFQEFALQLQALTSGDETASPTAAGYLPVIGDAVFNGVDGSKWWALRYQVDMGTPGALAGDIGLNSTLITAWTPDSSGTSGYKAFLGIELPGTGGGAKLISLQNVLKLSIGQIRLTQASGGSFLLMLTDIALRFLGLINLPPAGKGLFYLFGNPAGASSPSGLGWYAMYLNYPTSSGELP